MKHWMIPLMAAGLLAACGGDNNAQFGPGGGGGGGDETPVEDGEIPTDDLDDTPIADQPDGCEASSLTCVGDLSAAEYVDNGGAPDDLLLITNFAYDRAPLEATYEYTGDTVNGFMIFSNVYDSGVPGDDPGYIDAYRALSAETDDGSIRVGVIGHVGDNFWGPKGAFYELSDEAALPSGNLLVQYTGEYASLMDFFGNGQLFTTTGDVQIDADLTDNVIRGIVYNRTPEDEAGGDGNLDVTPFGELAPESQLLPNILLLATELVDGTFDGRAVSYIDEDIYESGSYVGLIGGSADESYVGGVVEVSSSDAFPDSTDFNIRSRDTGAFVTDQGVIVGVDP